MNLDDLIKILENKLAAIGQLKMSASNVGDVEQVVKLEENEAVTSTLIAQLKQIYIGNVE